MLMQLRDAVTKLNDADKNVRDAAMAAVLQAREGAVGPLVDALNHPGAPVAKIALLLAALKARQGVGKLVDLLNKGVLDVDTRAVVARAFGELVDGRDAFEDKVRRAVLNLSKDTHTTTRQLTVKALHAIGDGDSEARLQEMAASDPDITTRKAALDAVKQIRAVRAANEAAMAALNGPPVGSGAHAHAHEMEEGGLALDLEALARQQAAASGSVVTTMRPPEVDAPSGPHAHLVRKLRDPRWAMRGPAVDEVVALAAGNAKERAEIVATLVDVLAGEHVGAKIGAAQALARIQAPEAARALLDVVTTPVPASADDELKQLRAIGLKALACSLTGSEEGFAQPLLPLVRDIDPFVRAGALLCLGRLADRVGARAATVALGDPHDHVVEAAAVALSEGTREEDRDLVLPLLAVLGGIPSPTIAVREAILLALSRIHMDPASSSDAAAILLRLRHRVRPSVLGMTSSLRRTAIAILERCYSPTDDPAPVGIVDDVLGRLADEHPEVRLLAASFLAQHMEPGLTGAVEKIEDALDREERPVSMLCLEALRKHDTAKAKQALEACAEDADEAIAARAKELLAGFEPQTQEWSPPEHAAGPVGAGAQPHATTEEGPPVEMPTVPEPPRRSRVRAVSGEEGSAVVEAKDGSSPHDDDTNARLKARLSAVKALGNDPGARAAVIERFLASVPAPRRSLKEELGSLSGLSEEEKRARREAILNRF